MLAVVLEQYPQADMVGTQQAMHWAVKVGSGKSAVCYEFQPKGMKMGRESTMDQAGFLRLVRGCKHGMEARPLGSTPRSHTEIEQWAKAFGREKTYGGPGTHFGGKTSQDFAKELCEFLNIPSSKLPWRQAKEVEAKVGGAAVAVGAVALGAVLLGKFLGGMAAAKSDAPDGSKPKKGAAGATDASVQAGTSASSGSEM